MCVTLIKNNRFFFLISNIKEKVEFFSSTNGEHVPKAHVSTLVRNTRATAATKTAETLTTRKSSFRFAMILLEINKSK